MKNAVHSALSAIALVALTLFRPPPTIAFEGRINVALTQGGQTNDLLYTVGPEHLRIEVTGTNWPNPIDIMERQSGALTLVYPHNHSFVRMKSATETAPPGMPGFPGMPMPPGGLPPGIGPQPPSSPTLQSSIPRMPSMPSRAPPEIGPQTNTMPVAPPMPSIPNTPALPTGVGPQPPTSPILQSSIPPMPPPPAMPNMPGGVPPGIGPQSSSSPTLQSSIPPMPRMPMPPMMMNQKLELTATGQTTNIFGFACQQYQLKQRGETMDIWATDQLLPYQPYTRNQPHRFGPRMLEEQWGGLVAEKKLFPLIASLHYDNGAERLRFEVTSISTDKVVEPSDKLFQPPPDYNEVEPLPF